MATARQLDPTGTLTLRNRFVAEMDRRFRFLKAVIHDAVVGADIFGLVESKTFLVSSLASDTDEFLITHAPRKTSQKRAQARLSKKAFAFETDQKKVEKFRGWLDQQAQAGILSVDLGAAKFSSDVRWSDQYVGSAYRKGITDGFIDTKKAAGSSLTKKLALGFGAMATGTAGEFLRDSFSRPIHADRVAMLYTRAYDELKGITAGMSAKIGSSLAQGMAEGRGPRQIASMMNKQVDLGLNRARVLARTEVIRAHAEGKLNTYESLGIQRVEAQVEFTTAKDTRVCKRCRDLQGKLFSVGTGGAKIKEKPKPAPELRPKKVKRRVKAKKKAVRRRGGRTTLPGPGGLTQEEQDAVLNYSAGVDSFQPELQAGNDHLIPKGDRATVKGMTAAIEKQAPLPKGTKLYRMVQDASFLPQEVGGVVTDKAFMSTSSAKSVMAEFAEDQGIDHYSTMEITAKGSVKGLNMNKVIPNSYFAWQKEIVLQRGVKLTLTGLEGRTYKFDASLVAPQKKPKPIARRGGKTVLAMKARRQRALSTHRPMTKAKMKIALASERRVARAIKGTALKDNEPMDVIIGRNGIEVKTIIAGKNPKITMHPSSRRRKLKWAKDNGAKIHTVVIRGKKIYYREGVGSFRIKNMEELKAMIELQKRMI